jgi:hypothetical protein
MDIFVDGKVIVLDDYKKMMVTGNKSKPFTTPLQDKGQKNELVSFAAGLKSATWPLPLWEQLQTTRISLLVQKYLAPIK